MPTRVTATVDPARSRTEARTARGQPISMDADPPHGSDSAPGPKETLLAALAGCTGMDVASLLRKKRQTATRYEISVVGASARLHPRVFTRIVVRHAVAGVVDPEALRRSIELSATRYCPINAMLAATATIEHWYELTADDGERRAALVVVRGPQGTRVL